MVSDVKDYKLKKITNLFNVLFGKIVSLPWLNFVTKTGNSLLNIKSDRYNLLNKN